MKPATLIGRLTVLATVALVLALVGSAQAMDGGTIGSADAQFTGESAGDKVGYRAVAGVGDVNGDGFDDLLVGAYGNDEGGTDAGAAYLLLGGPGSWGLRTSVAHPAAIKFIGEAPGDNAGSSVAGAGDVNGDGFDDLLIGAAANGQAGYQAGAAYLVLGSSAPSGGSLNGTGGDTIFRYTGEASLDRAGVSVAGAGDVNADGYADMLIGAIGHTGSASSAGAAYLVLGGATLYGGSLNGSGGDAVYCYEGESSLDAAGTRVAGSGDVNGDGFADILVGASGQDAGGPGAGAAYLVMGKAAPSSGGLNGGSGNTIYKYTGESSGDYAGIGVSGAGDVNGDGFDDILIGAEGSDSGGTDSGAAYLVLGSRQPSSGSLGSVWGDTIIRYSGEAGGDLAGFSVAGAGDVNGDSYADLLIGARNYDDGGGDSGAAYLVLGSAHPRGDTLGETAEDTIYRFTGESRSDSAGSSVAGAGDVDGDGYADLLVGAENNDDGGANAGAAYLILGDLATHGADPMRQRHRLQSGSDAPAVSFVQAGVLVDMEAGALSSGEIVVDRHFFHPCNTSKWLQMPIWTIQSNKINVNSGSTIELWFEYTDDQIAGMVEQNLTVWKRPDGHNCIDWTPVTGSVSVDPLVNRVRVLMTGVTSLSQFTLADAEPSPTAVRAISMGTHLAQEPIWLVVLLAMLVLASGSTYWYLSRQEERALAAPQSPDLTDVIATKVADLLRDRSEDQE